MTIVQAQTATIQTVRTGIIDCDVHPSPRSVDEIRAYMPMPLSGDLSGDCCVFCSYGDVACPPRQAAQAAEMNDATAAWRSIAPRIPRASDTDA